MAHANPEFALACRAHRGVPEPTYATLSELRERMRQIGECIRLDVPVFDDEREAYRLWLTTVRQQRAVTARGRQLAAAVTPSGGGMHAGDPKGLKFVPPVRRGEGRTKRWQVS